MVARRARRLGRRLLALSVSVTAVLSAALLVVTLVVDLTPVVLGISARIDDRSYPLFERVEGLTLEVDRTTISNERPMQGDFVSIEGWVANHSTTWITSQLGVVVRETQLFTENVVPESRMVADSLVLANSSLDGDRLAPGTSHWFRLVFKVARASSRPVAIAVAANWVDEAGYPDQRIAQVTNNFAVRMADLPRQVQDALRWFPLVARTMTSGLFLWLAFAAWRRRAPTFSRIRRVLLVVSICAAMALLLRISIAPPADAQGNAELLVALIASWCLGPVAVVAIAGLRGKGRLIGVALAAAYLDLLIGSFQGARGALLVVPLLALIVATLVASAAADNMLRGASTSWARYGMFVSISLALGTTIALIWPLGFS